MLNALFVYGTLKRGHLRSGIWPHPPQSIESAVARGRLLDLGPYPGLIDGDDWVLGEVWILAEHHIAKTLAILDEVEGYDGEVDRGLYLRREVLVWFLDPTRGLSDDATRRAYTYVIADQDRIDAARRIQPATVIADRLAAQWPDAQSRVPARLEDE